MTFYMETTRINPLRTVNEIMEILSENGATAILTNYEGGEISALSFKIKAKGEEIPFMLPCRWQNVKALLIKENKRARGDDTMDTWAKRVAWRQILRWVEAQLAIVKTSMVTIQEVFLPYIQTGPNQSLYQKIEERGFKTLEHKP